MSDTAIDVMGQVVADAARRRGLSLAVAESLTGGLIASALARAEEASTWFRGGVVAYATEVKHDVLGVRPGPVVSEAAVVDMAGNVARLLGADVGVAVSGVGGPEPQDGEPPGTVWIGVATATSTTARLHRFEDDPAAVCEATVTAALGHPGRGDPLTGSCRGAVKRRRRPRPAPACPSSSGPRCRPPWPPRRARHGS